MQDYAECLPADVRERPERLGAWLYSCADVAHLEEASLQAIMPSTLLQVRAFAPFRLLGTHQSCDSHCHGFMTTRTRLGADRHQMILLGLKSSHLGRSVTSTLGSNCLPILLAALRL